MTTTPPAPGTVTLHRVLRAPVERVYRALVDADALCKWMPPHGFTAHVHQLDAREGGTFRMSFTNFTTGDTHHFGGTYVEVVPNERLRNTDRFDDAQWPGEMVTTYVLRAVPSGTELHITQEGIPAAIPVDGCHVGWQDSLQQLAQLVEAEIPA